MSLASKGRAQRAKRRESGEGDAQSPQTDQELDARIAELIAHAEQGLPADEVPGFSEFAKRLYAEETEDELSHTTVDQLYGAAVSLWRLGAKRAPGEAKLRVYDPSIEEHGWRSTHTVIELVNDDMPFLVRSITAVCTGRGLGIHLLAHPVIETRRDADGARADDDATDAAPVDESVMHIQIDRVATPADREKLAADLRAVLSDVRVAVDDWTPMCERLADVAAELKGSAPHDPDEVSEAILFLEWLAADHFTLLSARDYTVVGGENGRTLIPEPDSGLGLMRDPAFMVFKNAEGDFVESSPETDAFIDDPAPLQILKANRRSTIHRTTHMDLVSVKRFGADGQVIGERRILGLFTSVAYARTPANIPFLRRKVARMVERAGYAKDSHNASALENVLATFPRDELFQIAEDELFGVSQGILMLEQRPRTRLFLRRDRYERFVSALLYTTRDRYNSLLREQVGEMLVDAFNGRLSSFYPSFGDGPLARVQYIIVTRPGEVPDVDAEDLEERAADLSRSWSDELRAALLERHGEAAGLALHKKYARAFDPAYQAYFTADAAVGDVELIDGVATDPDRDVALKFYRRVEDADCVLRLKLMNCGAPIPLSDCLPVLEKMGLKVLEERPFEIRPAGADQTIWMHDFLAELRSGAPVDLAEMRAKLEEAFLAVWMGAVENDGYNRLITAAGLSAREVAILRAYAHYLRQVGLGLSGAYLQETLAKQYGVTQALIRLFAARFDPAGEDDPDARAAAAAAIAAEIDAVLEQVESLDEDRILRRFKNAIEATLRTNAYQEGPRPALAFKLDSQALEDLPLPRPYREIWVYSPQVEGVHLRFGPVARGGLRWSDRREDFRTEVLGLVKAQQVKNAVIVPVGSKGGFYPKQLPEGGAREEVFEAGRDAYKTFITSLLDVTDNLAGDQIVPPENVVRHDADDPYLVVAADKGTATFSDTANAIAVARGFWLGDAFASGGGNGYDHKAMGITARGAWEAVKRHFRELGTDIQTQPFTVIGVGDMSGDVFGNGMLLSKQIRLLAAFDHRDVFIDPDPDPAKSWDERKRLFETPRTTWRDYDPSLISKGGGVFPRSAKSVELTPEIQAITGLEAKKVTPAQLISALLRAQADLLWFGGIGTYVKAATETHADAGDRANDAIRADADQLRVRVIGEGANLGITQRGRIAFCRNGGRINTDAVDNSAGVDCSDHEVNIKIALGQVVSDGDMTLKQRNQLLEVMTEEVGELVLKTNYRQTLALTLEEFDAAARLEDHRRVMEALEDEGRLNRAVELLPDDASLAERRTAEEGLARPELAVLLAYSKIVLFDELVAGDAPDDPAAFDLLLGYMPGPISENHRVALEKHRLRREIIATVLANAMIDEGGLDFAHRQREAAATDAAGVARAFLAARAVFGLPQLRAAVNALDNQVSAMQQLRMHQAIRSALTAQTSRLLEAGVATQPIADTLTRFTGPLSAIRRTIQAGDLSIGEPSLASRAAVFSADGVPTDLAQAVAALPLQEGAIDIAEAAARVARPPQDAATAWFTIGEALELDWLRASAEVAMLSDRWDRLALSSLSGDLRAHQRRMVEAALASDAPAAEAAAAWIESAAPKLGRYRAAVADARRSAGAGEGVSRLSVLIGALGQAAG